MTRILATVAFIACVVFGPAAHAAIESRAADSFVVALDGRLPLAPRAAQARFLNVQDWWSGAHTFSGDARNLRMERKAGGCWCERLADGGFVEHMRLVQLAPGAALVLRGALGPLTSMGAQGTLLISFQSAAGASGSDTTWRYVVTGPGVGAMADAVDAVMAEQFARFLAVDSAQR